MTRTELIQTLAFMGELWPNWQQPKSREQAEIRLEVWSRLLAGLDAPAVLAAVESMATDGREFAPSPGSVRRAVAALMASEGAAPSPEEAWAEVLSMIHSVGYTTGFDWCGSGCRGDDCDHRALVWSHPTVEAAVNGLGWEYLCRSENQMADRAHFMKFYGSAVERGVSRAAMPVSVQAILGVGPGIMSELGDGK